MNIKELLEDYERNIRSLLGYESYRMLPSYCNCKGILDFINSNTLKCRECKKIYSIDDLLRGILEKNND